MFEFEFEFNKIPKKESYVLLRNFVFLQFSKGKKYPHFPPPTATRLFFQKRSLPL